MATKLGTYIAETRAELKHVTWPTRRQAVVFTAVVILISIGVAVFLGLFDYVFQSGIAKIIA